MLKEDNELHLHLVATLFSPESCRSPRKNSFQQDLTLTLAGGFRPRLELAFAVGVYLGGEGTGECILSVKVLTKIAV